MILDIVEIGHPVLHEVAHEVAVAELATEVMQSFIDALVETKRAANGAGIAANQVNKTWRIFVVEVVDNPRYPYKPDFPLTIMINPEITFLTDERFDNYEGCLSVPNLRGVVERCPQVQVRGLDRHGKPLDFKVSGVSAGTFQHEQDHLDGILFTDRLKDSKSLCTWNEFSKRQEAAFGHSVRRLVARYGS